MTIELTSEQWKMVDEKAKLLVQDYTEDFNEEKFHRSEIYPVHDNGFEQREYGGNYFTLENALEGIIKDVLIEDKCLDEDEAYNMDFRRTEGFYDFVIDVEGWLSDALPSELYVYFEDGDIWVARNWENIEDIPEDIQHLVNE